MREIFLLAIAAVLFHSSAGQTKVCSKIDFNRAVINEFRECYQQFLPVLKPQKYSDQTAVTPYRPGTEFFLSPSVEGYSCLESVPVFKLDENSVIQAAIHVSFVDEGAFVSIVVVDLTANNEAYSWKYQQSHKWFMIEEKIMKKVPQAMIEIRTNMNKKSVLALEYLNIVNTNVQTPECTKAVPPPPTTVATTVLPPTETVPTYTFTSDEWTTTSEPFYPTDEWYPLPNDAVSVSPKMVSWLVLGGSISFIVLAIILALIFVFIIRPRHRARILHVTMPNNNSNTIPLDEKNDAYVQTLPRLHVHHDPISGPYISGVTSIKHLEETDAKLN